MENVIGILGNGGQARETASYAFVPVKFRAVNRAYITGDATDVIDIEAPESTFIEVPVNAAVGAPAVKRELISKWQGSRYATVVSEAAYIDSSVVVKPGSTIAPGAVITTNVHIGAHVLVNACASVQHDSTVGDFSTISPGVHVGGNVTIGEGVFIGMGASIIQGLTVANGVVIGAGSTLLENASVENGVYLGTPAKYTKQNKGWLNEI